MSVVPTQPRRGAALLLVLATVVLVVTSAATLGAAVDSLRAARTTGARAALADDLCAQAEACARRWLAREAGAAALPPSALVPEVTVLHDAWEHGGARHVLRLTAWDQNGLVPLSHARAGSPLRGTLPQAVRRAVDRPRASRAAPAGLDQFQDPLGRGSPFPLPRRAEPARFGEEAQDGAADVLAPVAIDAGPAVGGWVATHGAPAGRVNVNTAPLPLVEAVLRATGRGGLELVREARARGVPADLGALAAVGPEDDPGAGLQLAASSDAWAFRVDVEVGGLARSWWLVFELREEWHLVQRLAITT